MLETLVKFLIFLGDVIGESLVLMSSKFYRSRKKILKGDRRLILFRRDLIRKKSLAL